MHVPSAMRRRVLQGGAGLMASLGSRLSLGQTAPDYRALVCIFQEGGNDGENTLIRFDTAGYQTYAAARPPSSGLHIAQGQLLPIQPIGGPALALHPACAALKAQFEQGRLAIVANMGMLAQPTTRAALSLPGARPPSNLFSHSDQVRGIQAADALTLSRLGWGGRIADRLGSYNGANLFPPIVMTDGRGVFGSGESTIPLTIPPGATLQQATTPDGGADALAEAAIRQILQLRRDNFYDMVARAYANEALSSSSVASPILLNPGSAVRAHFADKGGMLAQQLLNVALMIEGRGQTGLKRQIFFVRHPGYDTHAAQLGLHHALLSEFSEALATFSSAMQTLGLASNVTTFSMSDFGRTFKPAANAGTDHGWGNYAFVSGGAVRGGRLYGTLPVPAVGGPDDYGDAGRWIPTTSIEQYGATLARWFGLGELDIGHVFPNLAAFSVKDLGFMT